jgi:TRAP-type C4-dicarboxylate transport system permease large subunit
MARREANYVARAAIPFFFMMLLAIAIVAAFPAIATWLPDAVLGVTKK